MQVRVLEMSILLFLVFFPLFSLGHRLEGCEDSWCKSHGPIIHFPFRLSHQPKHCGYDPGFELHCNNKKDTILELPSSVHLVVEKIDYVSQQIHLYDECIAAKLPKLNLSQSNFTNDDDPTDLFNCSAPFSDNNYDYYLVPCLGSPGYQVHAVSLTSRLQYFLSGPCTKIHQYPYSDSTFGENMLQLNWSVPLCGNCESKGMDCGFKDGTKLLETHCFNRTITQKGIKFKQPLIAEKELGFKRRRREEGEEEEKKEEINKIGQDHCGFSSGVIPIKIQVPRISILHVVDPAEHSRVSDSHASTKSW